MIFIWKLNHLIIIITDLENIASVLAARYVVARETAKRQKARTVKEEDQDMKSIQVK